MDKCIIWGAGQEYENIVNQILFEIEKGNLEVIAIVSDIDHKYFYNKDGFSVVKKEKLHELEFDYLIITSTKCYTEIENEAILLGIKKNKIIHGNVFKIPLFDWKRYISLVKRPISILSDDCWGGYLYHKLYLPFSSPCINISWPKEDYIKFAQDVFYYLDQPLEMEREGELRKNLYPIGRIGSGDKKIHMDFVHAACFQDAKKLWDRRKERVNRDRIFVKFSLPAYLENYKVLLREFNKILFPKIAFFSGGGGRIRKCYIFAKI